MLQPSGEKRYKLLSVIVKSALILGQTNAESECSLSVNARVVTQDRSLLNEETIIGLRVVKEAVRFHDPISHQPEKIVITEELKRYVRSAYTSYQEWLKREQEEKEREKEEAEKRKAISEKVQKERDRLLEKKASMPKAEKSLHEQEEKARQDLEAADEVLKDASAKLKNALKSKSLSASAVTAAEKMIDTSSEMRKDAMEKLDDIRRKHKLLYKKSQKLLDEALPTEDSSQHEGRSEP